MGAGWMAGMALCLTLGGQAASAEAYTVDEVSVRAKVLTDGDLFVEELFTYTLHEPVDELERHVGLGGAGGVEFFEAYVPPKGAKLGSFAHQGLKQLDTAFREEDEFFYTFPAVKEGTQELYYRYRVDQAASRYVRTGELEWKFFEDSDTDIHNVTMEILLPQTFKEDQVHAFLHDPTGGRLQVMPPSTVRYDNPNLSMYGSGAVRLLFPSEFLPEAPTKSEAVRVEDILKEEAAREKRFGMREMLLGAGKAVSAGLIVLVLGAVLTLLFSLKGRLAGLRTGRRGLKELAETDPVRLSFLYRLGELQAGDFAAGLFSQRRRGLLTASAVPAENRFCTEEGAFHTSLQFVRTGKGSGDTASDAKLNAWLLRSRKQGIPSVRIDSLAGPTLTEYRSGKRTAYYRNKRRGFLAGFRPWKESVEAELAGACFRPYSPLRRYGRGLAALHALLLLYLFYADAQPWDVLLYLLLFLAAGGGFTLHRIEQKWRLALYLFACFVAGAIIVDAAASGVYLLFVLGSLLLVPLLPRRSLTWEAAGDRGSIRSWRRKLKQGAVGAETEELSVLEKYAEAAVLLGVGREYLTKLQERLKAAGRTADSPLLSLSGGMQSVLYTQTTLRFTSDGAASGQGSSGSSDSDGGGWDGDGSDSGGSDSGGGGDGGGGGGGD
ncbi:DUF2207 domain-containing protein [Paenibacillus mucilaginosus]|nr:DUF2207 domain-containing protein [Paenibacillus mucilaginosus]WFA20070.1 DUF2207 domain-containing protein [Paenibacillus mucilaginosus]